MKLHLRKMFRCFTAILAGTALLSVSGLPLAPVLTAAAAPVQQDYSIAMLDAGELPEEWKADQVFELADPAPWNLQELKKVVDVQDPRSIAAYWVWAVNRLADDFDDGMEMMRYLFADLEVYGTGFVEGGNSNMAGWTSFFTDRLDDPHYHWLPRAYFEGASAGNGFAPARPLQVRLYYNDTNTKTANAQSFHSLGRLNIIYWVQSNAGGNKVNITLSHFEDSDRWYVTSGASSSNLFYDQSGALEEDAKALLLTVANDDSTEEEHKARYQEEAETEENAAGEEAAETEPAETEADQAEAELTETETAEAEAAETEAAEAKTAEAEAAETEAAEAEAAEAEEADTEPAGTDQAETDTVDETPAETRPLRARMRRLMVLVPERYQD